MARRTRTLLIILLLLSAAALWLNVDWSKLGRFYHGLRLAQASMLTDEQNEQILQGLKKDFGEQASFSYIVSSDHNGTVTKTVRAILTCSSINPPRYLDAVVRRVHDAGLGWPDKVEFVYTCGFVRPPSFELTPREMSQAMEERAKEDFTCRDVRAGTYSIPGTQTQQSMFVQDGAVDMKFSKDEDGRVVKAQWTTGEQFMQPKEQLRLMRCMTYALLRTLAPELSTQEVQTEAGAIWPANGDSASVKIGRYTVESKSKPLEMVAYPVR